LALGWIVALGFYLSASDVPGEFLTDNVLPSALLLVAIAAPVALLFAWGEVDLSAFGALPFAGYVYSEASDAGVAPGVLAAVGAGLVIGLCLGLVRWATRAPSAVVTFAAGMVLHAVAFKQIGFEGTRLIDEAIARGSGLPFLAAVVFTASAVAAAVLFWRRAGVGGGDGEAGSPVGPAIIVGYGLSGAAVAAYGALVAGMDRAVVPTDGSMVLLLVLCGVAIGGVVRGNLLIAPITAALGALAAQLLFHTALARAWESFDARLLVAIVLLACLLLAHALHRALAPRPAPTG
jgi:ribose transport system permease protein